MEFIDTHAHLYAEQFEEDRDEMIQRAIAHGVTRVYLPNIDLASIPGMYALEAKYPNHCFPMMGLHPCSVKENFRVVLEEMETHLQERSFCAIGEIGMDLYWDKTFRKEQEEAFYIQCNWAMDRGIPIVIHSRDATQELIGLIEQINDKRLFGIFHCFGGSLEEAEQIISLGFLLGIGGVVTFKKSGLADTLRSIDLKNLVLETDAPYLSPTPYRGKRNESSYIPIIAQKIADSKSISIEEVAQTTTQNALRLFHPASSEVVSG